MLTGINDKTFKNYDFYMKKTRNNLKKEEFSMPLNRYLAHAGVCSRRQAVAFIKQGLVAVGHNIIKEPGYKVTAEDAVKFKIPEYQRDRKNNFSIDLDDIIEINGEPFSY